VYENFWNGELGCFVQYKGAEAVDASALLMPLVKFIGPTDPRWRFHVESDQRAVGGGFAGAPLQCVEGRGDRVWRDRGNVSMCSFWNVECLARAGDVKQARLYFEKALGYANHLGLFSEELGPSGEHLGNFPQAFTHLALISAAYYLDKKLPSAAYGTRSAE